MSPSFKSLARRRTRLGTQMSGVSLIELMVALVIGLLLIFGAVTVYTQSRNTYRTTETAARLQEVARYAMNVIEADARLAGYWGLVNLPFDIDNKAGSALTEPVSAVNAVVTGTSCGKNWTVNADRYIDGRNNGYGIGCPASVSAVDWADVLIVRRASTEEVTGALQAGQMYVTTNRSNGRFFAGTTAPTDLGTADVTETRNLIANAYYIAQWNSPDGKTQWSLRRKRLSNGGAAPQIADEEIIPGVEDLQVQFGVDSDEDGQADVYLNPGAVPDTDMVMSVRIWLLITAETDEVGFTNDTEWVYADQDHGQFDDQRRRVLVSKTIQIRNSRLPPSPAS